MIHDEIVALEQKIYGLTQELHTLKMQAERVTVPNYMFQTLEGSVSLQDLFAGSDKLLLIHNMGQGCRYCTLWGDGINPLLEHLESTVSVAMVSKDTPSVQRRFANSRGWRFRMASHAESDYSTEQTVMAGQSNYPGVVAYERDGDNIVRTNASPFGPGDLYCVLWNLLSVAGVDGSSFTPQFEYWQQLKVLDDGGENRPE